MDENTLLRRDRIAKVAEIFPESSNPLLIVNDRTKALRRISGVRWNRFSVGNQQGTLWPEVNQQEALIRLDTNKPAMKALLRAVNSVLPDNSPVWIIGGNDEGIKSLAKVSQGLLRDVETIAIKKRCRLLRGWSVFQPTTLQSEIQETEIVLAGETKKWEYYPGSFSRGTVDLGTQLLLDSLDSFEVKSPTQFADFACGTGVLAGRLRQLFPAAHIDAIEADAWSLNAVRQNVPDVVHLLSDGWSKVPNDRRYKLIVSNPPVHIGKEQDFSILRRLFSGAIHRLHRKGEMRVVLQGQVVLPKIIGEQYRTCEVIQQNRSYKVWRVCAPHR